LQKQKRENIRRAVFLIYLMLTIRLIIFKYPFADLKEIMDTWQSGVILRGLETANFRLFKTVRMYIVYRDRLNSFENLFGNVAIFIPFGALLPWVDSRFAAWWKVLVNAFLFVAGIEVFQLFSSFGAFDVDDLLLNCFGAMLGYWGWLVFGRRLDRGRG